MIVDSKETSGWTWTSWSCRLKTMTFDRVRPARQWNTASTLTVRFTQLSVFSVKLVKSQTN